MNDKRSGKPLDSMYGGGRLKLPFGEGWEPPTDVFETADHLVVVIDLAGIDTEQLNVRYEKGNLFIDGVRPVKTPSEEIHRYYKKEIDYGSFSIRVKLMSRIRVDAIDARYQDGMLRVELEKDNSNIKNTIEIEVKEKKSEENR
jgi:HSP20 family protein